MTVLGLDIGTTSCKCVAFDESFNVVAKAHKKYPLTNNEQNPEDWWTATVETIKKVSESEQITAIGISSQGITFVPVDKEGRTLMNAITWLDMRADAECELIKSKFNDHDIFSVTGKRINPVYTLPKLMWLKTKRPDVYDRTYKFLMAHDYIINRLCGAFITEDSLAAGTMAYDITKMTWYKDILNSTGIDISKLPEISKSGTVAGTLTEKSAMELGLNTDVKITTGGQDQKCAAFGAGIDEETAAVSLGTSAAISTLYSKPVFTEDMSLPCFPFIDGNNWVLEGFGSTAGAAIKWFKENLGNGKTIDEIDNSIEEIYEEPARVMFFPYMEGTGSPEWYDKCGGCFIGLSLDTKENHMAKSVLESIAFTIRANIEKMESFGKEFKSISVFGGGAYSSIWLRIIADITGKSVMVPEIKQTACLGAAMKSTERKYAVKIEKKLEADIVKYNYYSELYKEYKIIEKKIYGR